MHLLALIFGIILFPKAYTLKCYGCLETSSGSCTDTVTECPSQSFQCSAIRLISYEGDLKTLDFSEKTCALAEDCVTASINTGMDRTVFTSKCCTSDLCNTQPAPDPTRSGLNGKKCLTCNEQTCNGTVNCEGNEDYCFSASTVSAIGQTVKGCASKLMCSKLQSAQLSSVFGGDSNCCQGNYCNSASSSVCAGLLLLVPPLIPLVLYS